MSENILPQVIQDAKNKTLAQFELKYTGWYLYGSPAAEDENHINYKTDVISDIELRKLVAQSKNKNSKAISMNGSPNVSEYFVYEIKKKPSNAFAGWISIGRAVNNDIVLRFPTVSKLHARLEIETTTFGDPLGYHIIDNNSTGRTVHNGNYLEPDQPAPLSIGDTVLFGSVQCIVIDATTLWNKLR
ncbi:MAG: FHA domain-containing protein [Deltaproteobacteria bacterium]|nr:FHA domain-containing protein [Deltaproteobacteria bacterium]MBN2673557.1 FHA domain-containing protein [Deltaproteobacteria bacterium]